LLRRAGHEVEIISAGDVAKRGCQFHAGFFENKPFEKDIPVYYSSALSIRFVAGLWSSMSMLRHLRARHLACPFDVVVIFNMWRSHVYCADYAVRKLRLPVILQYEDDSFANVQSDGIKTRYRRRALTELLKVLSGGIGVSPHLLSQLPAQIPQLLLRGVVGDDIVEERQQLPAKKQNRILFAGTHSEGNGVVELIESWGTVDLPGWELHITGQGHQTEQLRELAKKKQGIVFHGLVSREQLVQLLCTSWICINPYDTRRTSGGWFAFKIIEYLAAGAHCITTRMGELEPELEAGITYMDDNQPATIADTLKRVIDGRHYENEASFAAIRMFGPKAAAESLDRLLREVVVSHPTASSIQRRDERANSRSLSGNHST
jgi:glycosyltransferase involved in cell wall biosynthesis